MKENEKYLSEQLISYIGNKRKLIDFIGGHVDEIKARMGVDKISMLDGFAGSGVVSRSFKQHASILHSNDLEKYSHAIGTCYLANPDEMMKSRIANAIAWLNQNRHSGNVTGVIETHYAPANDLDIQPGERAFYTNENAKIIDTVRALIDQVDDDLRPFCMAPLLHRASVHTNTSGVFKGFYKNTEKNIGQFGGNGRNSLSRIMKEIVLDVPIFSNFASDWQMHNQDINQLIDDLDEVDVAYYDPPYNQHPYGSNYFMLNVILDNQAPVNPSLVSGIPADWNKSAYNKKQSAAESFDHLIANTKAKFILLSYSDGGILTMDELTDIFERHGRVSISTKSYPIFRGRRPSKDNASSAKVDEALFLIEK